MADKNPNQIIKKLAPNDNPFNFQDKQALNLWTLFNQGDYKGSAVVYKDPSEYGINGGNISKLDIRYKDKPILNYDREWDTPSGEFELAPEHLNFYNKLITALSEYGKNRG